MSLPSTLKLSGSSNFRTKILQILMTDGHLNRIDEENEEELENVNEIQEDNVTERERQIGNGKSAATVSAVGSEEIIPSMREARRECVVCFDFIGNNQKGIQPCPCGYWVHYHCLITGIQAYEADHPGCAPLGCRFCVTPYKISPRKNLAFKVLDKASLRFGQLCQFGYRAITVVFVDSTLTIVGFALLNKIYGHKEAEELLFSMDPIKAVAICKAIPLISIVINAIPWEMKLLRFLRRCPRLPVVGGLFPSADPRVKELKYRNTLFGVLVGGLLLPWHANVFGVKLFGAVQSRVGRFLLGGVTFLALKGALQMYYRQRIYARQCFLTVEAYHGD